MCGEAGSAHADYAGVLHACHDFLWGQFRMILQELQLVGTVYGWLPLVTFDSDGDGGFHHSCHVKAVADLCHCT